MSEPCQVYPTTNWLPSLTETVCFLKVTFSSCYPQCRFAEFSHCDTFLSLQNELQLIAGLSKMHNLSINIQEFYSTLK